MTVIMYGYFMREISSEFFWKNSNKNAVTAVMSKKAKKIPIPARMRAPTLRRRTGSSAGRATGGGLGRRGTC